MRVSKLVLMSMVTTALATSPDVAVFELSTAASDAEQVTTINDKDTFVYLSDRFNAADTIKLGHNKHAHKLIEFIDDHHKQRGDSQKPSMIVSLTGVEDPEQLFDRAPSFKVSLKHKHDSLTHTLFNKLPKQLLRASNYERVKLTQEIQLLTAESKDDHVLIQHFKYFNEKLVQVWNLFKSSQDGESAEKTTTLNLINDKLFINEVSQLSHLNSSLTLRPEDVVLVNLNALLSIGKKTGFDSATYQLATKVLADFLSLLQKFDVTVFAAPVQDKTESLSDALNDRHRELNGIFKLSDFSKRSVGANGACYTTKDSCNVGTSDCNQHGACVETKNGCWTCACAPTFDKKIQKTTRWAGQDCSKKVVAAEAHLFLWTGLALLVLFAGGIQLLASVGNEALPGVLDAATSSKKAN